VPILPNRITDDYVHALQWTYHKIDKRGILVSPVRLQKARTEVKDAIAKELEIIKNIWGCHVYIGKDNDDKSKTSVNLNASSGKRTPLMKFKELGYEIPKVATRNEDGEYVSKESLAELALQKMLSQNQFNKPGGDPVIKSILKIRELTTLESRYINANLYQYESSSYYLTNYNVAGTTTGRRSSRKHSFGFGNNAQNFPKHGNTARIFRRCLIARPGKIYLFVDQMQAEDWAVSALAENYKAIEDLKTGVDRHKQLAMSVFNLPSEHYTEKEWKDSMERFLGKKIRHANNYGMKGNTMSDSLAKEAISMTPRHCQGLLDIANAVDPSIQKVFHKYVERCLYDTRILVTPWGRERQFFGLRAGDQGGNAKIFREAYSFIPQSSIGDNNGFALFALEQEPSNSKTPPACINECHDSIAQEIDDNVDTIWNYMQKTIVAYDREMVFHNGISIQVPVEGEIGYDFYSTITLKNNETGSKKLRDIRYKDVQIFYNQLKEKQAKALEEDRVQNVKEAAS
jgi:DNA polymerase I-like protein with 3'-5' exonuclease and polymerase domains